MAVFESDARWSHAPDWRLVQDTFVTLFRRGDPLDHTVSWLRDHDYKVVVLDTSAWQNESDLHEALAAALSFPSRHARNLDALNNFLIDVAGDYGFDPTTDAGLVLVITGYDQFRARSPRAVMLLDIFARQARGAALYGHRMACLVQSDQPYADFPPLGATKVNTASWPPDPPRGQPGSPLLEPVLR